MVEAEEVTRAAVEAATTVVGAALAGAATAALAVDSAGAATAVTTADMAALAEGHPTGDRADRVWAAKEAPSADLNMGAPTAVRDGIHWDRAAGRVLTAGAASTCLTALKCALRWRTDSGIPSAGRTPRWAVA
jgi:polygalacturonase